MPALQQASMSLPAAQSPQHEKECMLRSSRLTLCLHKRWYTKSMVHPTSGNNNSLHLVPHLPFSIPFTALTQTTATHSFVQQQKKSWSCLPLLSGCPFPAFAIPLLTLGQGRQEAAHKGVPSAVGVHQLLLAFQTKVSRPEARDSKWDMHGGGRGAAGPPH